ncbi:MAG: HIT domain-containing protein [Coriobacteriales bacterium]|jgi:histidine triad (HIT) family protein|nr:HIT domain-containing protein [Coriobacteriales bacterium]
MILDNECVFCKIISGELSSNKVYEDESVLAFEDANPQMPHHVLLIPKEHYASVADGVPEVLLGKLLAAAPKVAQICGIDQTGYRICINTGDDARQTVHHLHLHLLGGAKMPINMGAVD